MDKSRNDYLIIGYAYEYIYTVDFKRIMIYFKIVVLSRLDIVTK